MSVQMANQTNLCTEEFWAVKTKNVLVVVADVVVPSLSFLHSSVAAFLLVSQTFAPCLITSCHLSLFCTFYSIQLEVIP